jgi:hypothetical protein
MSTVRCDYKKCGKLFNKTPSKIKRDRHHFCSRECAQKFREENEQEWSPHIMNKRPHQIIRGFLAVRNIHHLNDFDVSRKVFR